MRRLCLLLTLVAAARAAADPEYTLRMGTMAPAGTAPAGSAASPTSAPPSSRRQNQSGRMRAYESSPLRHSAASASTRDTSVASQ